MGRIRALRVGALIVCITLFAFAETGKALVAARQNVSKFRLAVDGLPNRWLVTLSPSVSGPVGRASRAASLAAALQQQFGGTVLRVFSRAANGFLLQASEGTARLMSDDPRVLLIEQDVPAYPATTQWGPTWNLDRIDQPNLPGDSSYTYFPSGSGVQVYVIDSGILTSHVDFGGRADVVADEVGDGHNGQDCYGHGTHVAGLIGGATYGVAKAVSLHSVRVFDCSGSGSASDVISAVNDAVGDRDDHHASSPAVINMSLTTSSGVFLSLAINGALNDDITVVAAAGNNNADASGYAPANISGVIAVGATDASDARWYLSNYGSTVALFAPGANVVSDYIGTNNSTMTLSGTSMAAPHVAGVAALYLQGSPSASPSDVRNALVGYATYNVLSGIPSGTTNALLRSLGTPVFSYRFTSTSTLPGGYGLDVNQAIPSPSGSYQLAFQYDGNLVLYDHWYNAVWSTGTSGLGGFWATMQTDGNFVIYNTAYTPLFSTGTAGNPGAKITVQDDSNVVVYSSGGTPLWSRF